LLTVRHQPIESATWCEKLQSENCVTAADETQMMTEQLLHRM